jgi:hypothetical protein
VIKHLLPLLVLVAWLFESNDYRDILEVQYSIGGAWEDVPGPYVVVNGEYNVRVPNNRPAKFFRVRRSWGKPNL